MSKSDHIVNIYGGYKRVKPQQPTSYKEHANCKPPAI